MTEKRDDPFREEHACDDLITDEYLLEDARWKIGQSLATLHDKNVPEDWLTSCYLLPNSFEFSIQKKLGRSGINVANYLLSDIWGSAQGEDVKKDVKAGLLALHEIKQLEQLLVKDGVIDREAALIYFHSLRLFLNIFRAGTLVETLQEAEVAIPALVREEKRLEAYRNGPGAASRDQGEGNKERASEILKKCGGVNGYDALPYGRKKEFKEAIQKKCKFKDIRQVDNIIKKLKMESIDKN